MTQNKHCKDCIWCTECDVPDEVCTYYTPGSDDELDAIDIENYKQEVIEDWEEYASEYE